MPEAILEPELPIVDPHHHLWDNRTYATPEVDVHPFMTAIKPARRYLLDELRAEIRNAGPGQTVACRPNVDSDVPWERTVPELLELPV